MEVITSALNHKNDELFTLIKSQMTETDEELFMTSYYLYLQYGKDNAAFVVDFDMVWKWAGFATVGNAKTLLKKHFIENRDFKLAFAVAKAVLECGQNQHGGQNKEKILLTVNAFKKFCLKSSTIRAGEICDYYIKMENIMHQYTENQLEKYQMKTIELQQNLKQSQIETSVKRSEVLIEMSKNKNLVYVCKIQQLDNGNTIIKIGDTSDIESRMKALNAKFACKVIVLDIFLCDNSYRFEQFLHNSPEIVKYKYTTVINNMCSSTETYLINNYKQYDKIVRFINDNILKFTKDIEFMKLLIEDKKLNVEKDKITLEKDKINLINGLMQMCKNIEEIHNLLDKVFNTNETQSENITQEETTQQETKQETVAEQDTSTTKTETTQEEAKQEPVATSASISHIQGPVIQIYHKDDLSKVVKVFNSISDAIRTFNTYQPGDEKPSFTSIKLAFQHKTLYLEHRWNLINRDEPNQNQTREIGETVTTKQRKCGQVAMLNLDKTKIVKVYPLSKDAAADILQHPSAICSAIKYGSVLHNHYWIHLKDLPVSLKEEYEKNKPIPEKTPNLKGIKINVFNVKTNTLIKIFNSYVEINNELNISTKTIKKYMATGEAYNGTYKFTFV
jgi:hypothetical protein